MYKPTLSSLILFSLLLTPAVFAWDVAAHRLISEIALKRMSTQALAQTERYLMTLATEAKENLDFYRYCRFVNSNNHVLPIMSYWADWERYDHYQCTGYKHVINTFDNWHYSTHPINPTNDGSLPPPGDFPITNTKGALVETLQGNINILKLSGFEHLKPRALGFLIHQVGDIHQPLHLVSSYRDHECCRLPNGDLGGNRFNIISNGEKISLHSLWDSGLGKYNNPKIERRVLQLHAERLIDKHCQNNGSLDPKVWAEESVAIAKQYVYRNEYNRPLNPGDRLSNYYLTRGTEIAEKRIALAGCRLADTLNGIFN